jgi:spoIIIJ-associated protein
VKEVTASGLTVNEAVEDALNQLKATREEVEITILDEGKKRNIRDLREKACNC